MERLLADVFRELLLGHGVNYFLYFDVIASLSFQARIWTECYRSITEYVKIKYPSIICLH